MFPVDRLRRLRRTPGLRAMLRETSLAPAQLMYPMFVTTEPGVAIEPIGAMPGIARHSVASAVVEARSAHAEGVGSVILFGIPEAKDERGSSGWAANGPVPRAIAGIKDAIPDFVVAADVCLCEYTSHGHCGLVEEVGGVTDVANDATVELLARQALAYAKAGADIIAPSDMMDGRVGAIRRALDDDGFQHLAILSYAAKFASAFYGPFREAAGSTPAFGDRRGYQMDPANAEEALREVAADLAEGADIVMVKPALAYLDIIRRVKERFAVPVAAYNVSGEYAMVKFAAAAGVIDGERVMMETLLAIRRAGASLILTYFARHAARLLAS